MRLGHGHARSRRRGQRHLQAWCVVPKVKRRYTKRQIITAAKKVKVPKWVDEQGLKPVEPPKPVVHLRVVTEGTYIYCPYQSDAQIPASVCSIGSRTPTHPLCYRCPDGALFEERSGGRTFRRVVVGPTHPDSQSITFKVRVSKKKHGIEYTSARLHHGEVTMPFYETIVPGTFLTSKEHHGPMTDSQLDDLAKKAAQARLFARRGGTPPKQKQKRGKKMIGQEMKALIDDKNRRRGMPSKYWADSTATAGGRKTVTVTPRNDNTRKASGFASVPKKTRSEAPMSTESLISKEAKRLAKKGK